MIWIYRAKYGHDNYWYISVSLSVYDDGGCILLKAEDVRHPNGASQTAEQPVPSPVLSL